MGRSCCELSVRPSSFCLSSSARYFNVYRRAFFVLLVMSSMILGGGFGSVFVGIFARAGTVTRTSIGSVCVMEAMLYVGRVLLVLGDLL